LLVADAYGLLSNLEKVVHMLEFINLLGEETNLKRTN